MNALANLLDLSRMGSSLEGAYAESFFQLFGFISFLAVVGFMGVKFCKLFRLNSWIHRILFGDGRPFRETSLIQAIMPNKQARMRLYKLQMYLLVLLSLIAVAFIYILGNAAIVALVAKKMAVNRYTAFVIFMSLGAFVAICIADFLREADKLAAFLNQDRGDQNPLPGRAT